MDQTLHIPLNLAIWLGGILLTGSFWYGIYIGFKNRTEEKLKLFDNDMNEMNHRLDLLEDKVQHNEASLQQIMVKLDLFYKEASTNWNRIFEKLESYDEGIKSFYRDLPDIIKRQTNR